MSHDSGSMLLTRPWLKVFHRVQICDVTTTKNAILHHVNKVIENIRWQPPRSDSAKYGR